MSAHDESVAVCGETAADTRPQSPGGSTGGSPGLLAENMGPATELRQRIDALCEIFETRQIEHCVEAQREQHHVQLRWPLRNWSYGLVLAHPVGCGCELLPAHVLLEG